MESLSNNLLLNFFWLWNNKKTGLGQVRNRVSVDKDSYVEKEIYTEDNWKRSCIDTGRTENDYGKDRAPEIKVAYLPTYLSHKYCHFIDKESEFIDSQRSSSFVLFCLFGWLVGFFETGFLCEALS